MLHHLAVVAITAAAHGLAPSARALSFDDSPYLTDNPLVRAPCEASRLAWVPILPSTLRPAHVFIYKCVEGSEAHHSLGMHAAFTVTE